MLIKRCATEKTVSSIILWVYYFSQF